MSFEKLSILYEEKTKDSFTGKAEALFNPNQLSFQKSVSWGWTASAPSSKASSPGITEFKGVSPETLSINLFFDTYALNNATTRQSVTVHTSEIMKLAQVDKDLHRPPLCKLSWGYRGWESGELFRGVLESASRTFTLFLEDGTPVRATVDCRFREVPKGSELRSADVAKRYMVRPGDTLMGIAAMFYGDIAQWRRIADANGIEDPRVLLPGRMLSIPRIA